MEILSEKSLDKMTKKLLVIKSHERNKKRTLRNDKVDKSNR